MKVVSRLGSGLPLLPSPAPRPLPSPRGGGEALLRLTWALVAGGWALPPPCGEGLGWGASGKRIRQEGYSPMKPLIQHSLISRNQIEVSSPAPRPPPLPTRGRGGAYSVGVGTGGRRLGAPSPLWGGLGWGASGKNTRREGYDP
jgi:hypothetical protein